MTNINYLEDGKIAEFNGRRYVRDSKTGYYLCHDKVGSGSRLHRDIWEFYNCEIPKGYDVHHKDGDKSNNDISNLQLLTKKEHGEIHGKELSEEEREWRRNNVVKKACPAAAKWHSSEEGKEWHRKHIKKTWENKSKIRYVCDNCGKEFMSINSYSEKQNRFCCNACKSAFRRKSGVDNIERICEYCGKKFISGKYQKRRFCSMSCAAYGRHKKKHGD